MPFKRFRLVVAAVAVALVAFRQPRTPTL